ncbi:MAG: M48 family metallopeptidase [Thermomicrobiales bacterium]
MPLLLIAFIVAVLTWTILSVFLSVRQITHVRHTRGVVPADFARPHAGEETTSEDPRLEGVAPEEHQRAADYTVAREHLSIVSALFSLVLSLAWALGGLDLLYGALASAVPPSSALGVVFLLAVFGIGAVLHLPLDIYATFGLEQRFGFNRTSPGLFMADRCKRWAISSAVAVPLLFGCLWVMRNFAGFWWLWTWFGVLAIMLAAPSIYVRFIAPRFNRFTPLADEALRQRLETLLRRCGFRASGLFSMDASRRSAHGNAFFIGFGKAKRIVLFDTLLERSDPSEIEAVVAHELGHFRHRHILFGLARGAVVSFAALAGFGWLTRQDWLLPSFGIMHQDDALALLVCLMLFGAVAPLLAPFANALSRRHEFQADEYARRQVGAAPMVNALMKLSRDNAATLTPDPLHALFHASHPSVPLRVRALWEAEAREAKTRQVSEGVAVA